MTGPPSPIVVNSSQEGTGCKMRIVLGDIKNIQSRYIDTSNAMISLNIDIRRCLFKWLYKLLISVGQYCILPCSIIVITIITVIPYYTHVYDDVTMM